MVMDDNSCSRGHGFKSQHCILDGHFFTLICCKNCTVCLKRLKVNEKEAGVGPFFFKKNFVVYLLGGKIVNNLAKLCFMVNFRPLPASDFCIFSIMYTGEKQKMLKKMQSWRKCFR